MNSPVSALRLTDLRAQSRLGLERRIRELQVSTSNTATVLVLGRYRHDRENFPSGFDCDRVKFLTVHTSKGLEADHVIVLGLTAESLGFPSRVEDDPVLQLALPKPQSFPHAEERRLFYVALMRARRSITLVTLAGRESAFALELIKDHKIPTADEVG